MNGKKITEKEFIERCKKVITLDLLNYMEVLYILYVKSMVNLNLMLQDYQQNTLNVQNVIEKKDFMHLQIKLKQYTEIDTNI